jgi:hypothetical protein
MRQSRITVLTRLLEDSYIKYNRLTDQMQIKKTNFKININNVCDKVIYLLLYSPDFIHKTIFIFKTLFQYIYTVIHDRHYPRKRITLRQSRALRKVRRTFFLTPVSKWLFFQNNHLRALRVRGIKLTKTLQYSINVARVSLRIARDN